MIGQTVAELLDAHVGLDIEGIDRLYLNLYQPRLQTGGGVVAFFTGHRGAQVASTTLMAPMTRDFAAAVQAFAKREGVELVHFAKGQRKDDETQRRLKDFNATEGVLYIGVAQERCSTFRVTKRFSERTGTSFPWLYRSTVMCNQYYFYVVDEDFGPLFIKFAGYFPYTARACLNGHEHANCQLRKAGIAFEALSPQQAGAAERPPLARSPHRAGPARCVRTAGRRNQEHHLLATIDRTEAKALHRDHAQPGHSKQTVPLVHAQEGVG